MKDHQNEVRLQKILSQAGISSRRKAEEIIKEGRVTVNGRPVGELGFKVKVGDRIEVDGKPIWVPENHKYVALYKPRGYVTTMRDPQGRPTVADLIASIKERLYPVGRLDFDSEGLLLMTNDGELAFQVQHPRFQVLKVYRVKVKGLFSEEHLKTLSLGLTLEDGFFQPVEVKVEKRLPRNSWLCISIREGRNRVIRRALKRLGFQVIRLIRVQIGGLKLGSLKPGMYRELSAKEISELLS